MSSVAATYDRAAAPQDDCVDVTLYEEDEHGARVYLESRSFEYRPNALRWASAMRREGYIVEVKP